MQEIYRLKDLKKHNFLQSITGWLYTTSLECLHIEVGSFLSLAQLSYATLEVLATPSLVKSSWQFLDEHKIDLQTNLAFQPQREHDQAIMELAFSYSEEWTITRSINHCRLYLRAFFVSNITCALGDQILDDAWNGGDNLNLKRLQSWPTQGKPTSQDWTIWQAFLKSCLLSRGRKLRRPLGDWISMDPSWEWYYDIWVRQLLWRSNDMWTAYPIAHDKQTRPTFSMSGRPTVQPKTLFRATVYRRGQFFVCTGYGRVSSPYLLPHAPSSITEYPSPVHVVPLTSE